MKKRKQLPKSLSPNPTKETRQTPVTLWCDRLITLGFYVLFSLIPLLLTPWNYELFEFNKMVGVYAITVMIAGSWIIKMIQQKEIRVPKTPLDIPIALFVLSQLVSTIFSIDPHVSWFGYYSRFNGGMWSVICYVLLYYAYMSHETNTSYKTNLLKTTLASATLVAIYGVLEHFGIDKNIWVQDVQNRVFSTLGQPNWLAAYLVALIPLSIALALNNKLYWLLSILFFTVLLFTKSRSGLLGFAVADIVFWGLLFIRPSLAETLSASSRGKGKAFITLHILFVAIIFFIGTGSPAIDQWITFKGLRNTLTSQRSNEVTKPTNNAGPALEVGGTESGTIRKYVWQGALNAWKSTTKTMLIGTGTETFAFAFYQFRPVEHNLTSEWDFLYNKAHNEYLNYLATTGIFGLGSYLLCIGLFIIWYIKNLHKDMINNALFAGWFSILVTNFFGFSVVIMQVFLFLIPAIIISLSQTKHDEYKFKLTFPRWTRWIVATCTIILLFLIGKYWYADTLFASGYRNNRAGIFVNAAPFLQSATTLFPKEPSYHDELAQSFASLSLEAFENNSASKAAALASLAITESDKAIRQSPRNVTYFKTRTKVFYTLSVFNPSYNNDAVMALRNALTLSPNDPKIYYNLAILLGRQDEPKEAITLLLTAKKLKINYRDAYYALHVFYLEAKKPAEAKQILSEYLTVIDPNDKDFQERIR